MQMIEVVDGANFDVIGCKYTVDERAAALFSLGLYGGQLAAGRVTDDASVVADGIELTERLKQLLQDEPNVFDPRVNKVLREIYFPYTVTTHEGINTAAKYSVACDMLGVRPFDLFYHAITARSVLDGEMNEQEFVDFDPSRDQ
jgi:hypothetical protein